MGQGAGRVSMPLRILFCVLLLLASHALIAQSPYAVRLHDGLPVPVDLLVVALATVLALAPLLARRRFLGAYMLSAGLVSAVGGYWFTLVPWDRVLLTRQSFGLHLPQGWGDYLLVALPMFLATSYAALSRWSRIREDLLSRGADTDQVRHAAASSFLAGAGALCVACVASLAFVALLVDGALLMRAPDILQGPQGVALAVLVVGAAIWTMGRRMPRIPTPRAGAAPAASKRPRSSGWSLTRPS